jgi:hypothetical protein
MDYVRHQQNRVTASSALIDSYCQQLDTGGAAGDEATCSRDASRQPPSPTTTTPKSKNNKSKPLDILMLNKMRLRQRYMYTVIRRRRHPNAAS